ncbi:MAG TPA: hypothetical protein VIE65_02060, partial [Methylobacter sp.]
MQIPNSEQQEGPFEFGNGKSSFGGFSPTPESSNEQPQQWSNEGVFETNESSFLNAAESLSSDEYEYRKWSNEGVFETNEINNPYDNEDSEDSFLNTTENISSGGYESSVFEIMPSEANPGVWETEHTYFPSNSEQFGQEMGEKEFVPELSALSEILSELNESAGWQSEESLIDAYPNTETSFGNSYEMDPYAGIRPALTPEYANLAADEISHQLGPMPAMLALHEQLVSSNLRQVVLAALLGKAGRRSIRAIGQNISPAVYLRQISRLCREAAEQHENAISAEFAGELTSGLTENEAATPELEDFVQAYLEETQGWTAETENQGELWTEQEALPNNPAQLDCSGVEIPDPDRISQKDKATFKSGGSLAQGKADDRTGETPDALKAMHLTHYNVNEWEPRKEVHRAALSDLTIFIREHLSRNRDDILKVTITGSCSKTGSKAHNDVLSCRRSKAAARLMNLGLEGFGARLVFDTSGQGFTAAKCKGKNCEIPDYRAVLVTIHKPNKIPKPIPPELPGSCTYKIRCCSFKQDTLLSALLTDLLNATLPEDVKRLLEQHPLLKKILKPALAKVISLLKKKLPKLAKLEGALNKILKFVVVELIRVNAVFQIAERDTANPKIATLCYQGIGIRVKMPEIDLAV